MNNIRHIGTEDVGRLLGALGEQLQARGERHEIVVVGGSALIVMGFVSRVTRDVDVVALLEDGKLVSAEQLPSGLLEAAAIVAGDFGLPPDWLNSGPASLLRWDLPEGFLGRCERHEFGPALSVLFASRLDQIHLKLYAVVDQGAGRHLQDLQALAPSGPELLAAAGWCRTHDRSDGFRQILDRVLEHLGTDDAA